MIAIFTIGTQGDIRPCVGLGVGLQRAGHAVRIVTSENFEPMIRGAGLDFAPLCANFQSLLESNRGISERGLDMVAMARLFRERYADWARQWVPQGTAACEGADLVMGVGNSTLLAKALAEARGLPFVSVQLQPLTPSRLLPPMVLAGQRRVLPGSVSMGLYHALRLMVWYVMRPAINDIVRPGLGLRRYPWYGPYFDSGRPQNHVLYGFSRHVLPRPDDWPEGTQVAGYWFHDQPEWRPSPALQAFLDEGPKPVYVGFGSMVSSEADTFTDTVLDGVRRSGRRAVLATGWGGLNAQEGRHDENVFILGNAPHDRLFPLMSAAVHHGGAGTTAAAARAGIPSVVVPFYGDQPFWARRLHHRGVAPPLLDRKRMTGGDLANALAATRDPDMRTAAGKLGQAIRAEDGIGTAIRHITQWGYLSEPVEQMRRISLPA